MKAKPATAEQREKWEKIRRVGCILPRAIIMHNSCAGYTQIHHCGTNAGGRKDHDKVISLCKKHHAEISKLSLRVWQFHYATEAFLMKHLERILDHEND